MWHSVTPILDALAILDYFEHSRNIPGTPMAGVIHLLRPLSLGLKDFWNCVIATTSILIGNTTTTTIFSGSVIDGKA